MSAARLGVLGKRVPWPQNSPDPARPRRLPEQPDEREAVYRSDRRSGAEERGGEDRYCPRAEAAARGGVYAGEDYDNPDRPREGVGQHPQRGAGNEAPQREPLREAQHRPEHQPHQESEPEHDRIGRLGRGSSGGVRAEREDGAGTIPTASPAAFARIQRT